MKNRTAKSRMFLIPAALACLAAVFLTACGAGGQKDELSAMQLRERTLSEEAKEAVSLIDDHSFSQIYEYKMDEKMKEIHFFVEELKDGKLTILSQSCGAAPADGSFAVLIDPEEITLSWDDAKYSCLIDTSSGYTSTVSSHLSQMSPVVYNEKMAVAALASTQSSSIETVSVADYDNLIELSQEKYDRVLFITVAFTDFPSSGELLSYGRRLRDRADLSEETVRWLEWFNGMRIMDQLAISSVPSEFMDLPGTDISTEDAPAASETGTAAAETVLPEDWLLMVDGVLYRGTSETGPMGDAGSVDGIIQSVIAPGKTPSREGEANFGETGNPYTWDSGDGMIMAFVNDEYHIFYREAKEAPFSGSCCAFIKRIDGEQLIVDRAEWITSDDTARMKKLGLTEDDMPDGYYIHNPSQSRTVFQLTEHTLYHFIDWNRDFTQPDTSSSHPVVETTDLEQFRKYLDTYNDSMPGMPFFIEVKDGVVEKIAEEPMA